MFQIKDVCGFEWWELSSWDALVTLLCRPCHPSSLAVTRILFGFLMLIDISQERGLRHLDEKWASSLCHFPLFDFLQPLPIPWMYFIYFIMILGALGITFGVFYHQSCFLFLIPYWYIFLLDTTAWNNHSYLYGVIGYILLISNANRYWALDTYRKPDLRSTQVPLWNYAILRAQIFLVYFMAGLKKLNADWMGGFSMRNLSSHWVFAPFRVFLTEDQVDYYIVHLLAFIFDLTIGFLLFFDTTRSIAFLLCTIFNLMNSQLFSIGMFPFVMMATMPIFCSMDWPQKVFITLKKYWKMPKGKCHPQSSHIEKKHKITENFNDNCIYPSLHQSKLRRTSEKCSFKTKPQTRHHVAMMLVIVHLSLQLFLPYSHFITKGYNHWTEGLYGYSWNMMVHSWHNLHSRVIIKDKHNNEIYYLDPNKLVLRDRWNRYGRTAKQFGQCIEKILARHQIKDIEIYLDIWMSLNERFQQRIFDPKVNILTSDWSPFHTTTWVMPLLTELSNWRDLLKEKASQYDSKSIVVFVADFPGMTLENHIHKDLSDTLLETLEGKIKVEIPGKSNITLGKGEKIKLFSGEMHKITVISLTPACYTYVSRNKTSETLFSSSKKTCKKRSILMP